MGETSGADRHVARGRWEFDGDVAAVFDDMLARSIPAFGSMREITTRVATRALRAADDPHLLDLGCSRGGGIAPIVAAVPSCTAVGVEAAAPMRAAAAERFCSDPRVTILAHDLRHGLPAMRAPPTVIVACLTLQFVPIEHRQRLLEACRRTLQPNGVMVVVEKVLGATAAGDAALVSEYHAMKARNGYSAEQIAAKRRALEGVLVPLTAEENERRLSAAGFAVEPIWRAWNFAGWAAWPA